jgi:hypothetical protein
MSAKIHRIFRDRTSSLRSPDVNIPVSIQVTSRYMAITNYNYIIHIDYLFINNISNILIELDYANYAVHLGKLSLQTTNKNQYKTKSNIDPFNSNNNYCIHVKIINSITSIHFNYRSLMNYSEPLSPTPSTSFSP